MRALLIEQTLEAVAEKAGDPVPLVYERLFAAYPDMKPLFALDRSGAVQGSMLLEFIECLMDLAGPRAFAVGYLQTTRLNHEEYGVPPEVYPAFFETVRDTFREALGASWTADMEAAWAALYADFASVLELENA